MALELGRLGLNTVCTSARCPNLAECWNQGTATFMILGSICTRSCRFCSVARRSVRTGNPQKGVDADEPKRVASAARELGLRYVVVTSVDRDDLADLGATAFADTARELKKNNAGLRVEVLTPDFAGREELIGQVAEAGPDVFGHNIETVERMTPAVRDPLASYRRSLAVLASVKRAAPRMLTKSGLMVGLGETDAEVEATMLDLHAAGCDIVTVGQYLQPARKCLPVQRYVEPERFQVWENQARAMGFRAAACGPLMRSSFHASELLRETGQRSK